MEHERELQCLFERKHSSSNNRRSNINIEKNEIVPSCIFYRQPRFTRKQLYYQDECFKSAFPRDLSVDKRTIQIQNAETQKYHKQSPISNNNLALIDLPTTKENGYPETNIGIADKMTKAQSLLVYQPKKQLSYKQNSIAYYCCPARDNQCTKKNISPSIESLIYRSQHPSTGSCCCECNSDAMLETMKNLYYCYKNETCGCNSSVMFEVMENLYNCYKKKDCSDCSCKLCEIGSKKLVDTAVGEGLSKERIAQIPENKMRKGKEVGLLPIADKTKKEKKKVPRGVATLSMPQHKDKTTSSEHKLILKNTSSSPKPETSYEKKNIDAKGHKEDKSKTDKERALKQEKKMKVIPKAGKPLPQRRTSSAAQLIVKGRKEMRLPQKPSTASGRDRLAKTYEAGKVSPLEGKPKLEKEKNLRRKSDAVVPLPVGRSASERSLIKSHQTPKGKKVEHPKPLERRTKGEKDNISKPLHMRTDSERSLPPKKKRKTKEAGLVYPLQGKTKEEKEKFLRCLAKAGLPLPKGKTSSEVNLIQTVQKQKGLPTETQTVSEKEKFEKPYAAETSSLTLDTPLEGKRSAQIERRLRKRVAASKSLSETDLKTASDTAEKAPRVHTPLTGKTQSEKEKRLRRLAKTGKPLPKGKTVSEVKLIQKVQKEMGLPTEPQTQSENYRLAKAHVAGIVTPVDGKSKAGKEKLTKPYAAETPPLTPDTPLKEKTSAQIERRLRKRVAASKSLSETDLKTASDTAEKAPRFHTPLKGKTQSEKEKRLRRLAKTGKPLPKGKTVSEVKLIQKVQKEMGLPTEPQTQSEKYKFAKTHVAGIVTPLDSKSKPEKEKLAKPYAAETPPLTPDTPLEEKTSAQIERRLRKRVAASKSLSETDLKSASDTAEKAPRVHTPLKGKTQSEKEKRLRRLAKTGKPLPKGKTVSEVKLIQKVQKEMGLPTEPQTPSEKYRLAKAHVAGIVTPLDGKSKAEKERALRRMAAARIPLPEGRTDSEKALINKVKATTVKTPPVPYDKVRRAKEAGLLTPLDGKTEVEKEKILSGLAKIGLPLSGKTPSEEKLIKKIQSELGLPTEPQSSLQKDRLAKGYAAGIVTPLEGKTSAEKERGLRRMADAGVPLPEGRTSSEKSLIRAIEYTTERAPQIPLETLRKATEAGILTPLVGKSTREKEKILRCLAKAGIPLPKGKTLSEAKLIKRIRKEMGLPSKPQTPSEKVRLAKAYAAGIVTPLEGKSSAEKEKILRRMAAAGVPLPEGRTASERSLIKRIQTTIQRAPQIRPKKIYVPKEAGLLTSLEGKTNEEKEKILRCFAKVGIPLPEGKTPSEEKIIIKIRNEMEKPKISHKDRLKKPYAKGMVPLEGKKAKENKALQRMPGENAGMPITQRASDTVLVKKVKATPETIPKVPPKRLRKAKKARNRSPLERKTKEEEEKLLNEKLKKPYGREMAIPFKEKPMAKNEQTLRTEAATDVPLTSSDKSLDTDESSCKCLDYLQSLQISREKVRNAKETGLITVHKGKTKQEKEKFFRCLAKAGIPLPEGKTSSEVKLIRKVQKEMGLPREPSTTSGKYRFAKAYGAGIITSLEGKSPAEKEKVLRRMAAAGVPLPEGRTASERSLIKRIQQSPEMKQKKAGRLTPLEGKTNEEKEEYLRGLVKAGKPLPEGKTASERKIIQKIRKELELKSEKEKTKTEVKGGIEEEVIDIVKTTKCNRACGCDRKKIRFKNSYIKIHVESPDISSLCPCPSECLPVPKEHSHTYVDNEGINVIIANVAVDASSISSSLSFKTHNSIDQLLKPLSSVQYLPIKNSEIKSVESRTASENALIKNVRPSVDKMKQKPPEAKDGIDEKIMEIMNTTKFERACGCNRKKIKFKNSYIKIHVQSSDITSLSSCPYECLPETKECVHAFVDNEANKLIVENVAVYASYSPLSCSSKTKYDSLKGHLTPFSSIQYLPCQSCEIEHISDSSFRPPPPSYIVTPVTSKEIVKKRCTENVAIGEYKRSLSLTFFSATSLLSNRSIKSSIATHESHNSVVIVQSESWLSVSLGPNINKSTVMSFDCFDKTNNIFTDTGKNCVNMSSHCLDDPDKYLNVKTYDVDSYFESVTDICYNTRHLSADSLKITENLVVASLITENRKNDRKNILSENNAVRFAADSVQLSVTPSFSGTSTISLSSSADSNILKYGSSEENTHKLKRVTNILTHVENIERISKEKITKRKTMTKKLKNIMNISQSYGNYNYNNKIRTNSPNLYKLGEISQK